MIELLKSNKRIWELFTKMEEYESSKQDKVNRHSYSASKDKDILKPIVSEFLINNGLKIDFPENKKFSVCLSHDIDLIYYPELKMVFKLAQNLERININKILGKVPGKIYRRVNRLWNFDQIIELEKKYDAKSSFYFLALDVEDDDFRYHPEDIEGLLKDIISKGWEIGLHGGPEAFNNLAKLKKEKKKLEYICGKKIIGYRNHYLKFEIPISWELLSEAGFKYDSTYGYYDHVGFRNGMCHPFRPWNLNTKQLIDIIELPLIIMDATLLNYMNLNLKKAWENIKNLIDIVEKNQGMITILWHNSHMVDETLELYEKILKYCNSRRAWMTSGEEIWRWWIENDIFDL